MSYALASLWYEKHRFLPGVVAVAFSMLLILLQCGLLLGMFSLTATPIDHAPSELWVGHRMNLSVDLGRPVPERYLTRVAAQPEVVHAETYILGMIVLDKRSGGSELCTVIGSRLNDDSLGAVSQLTPQLRQRLSEPGAVVVDRSDLGRLGFQRPGDVAEVMGKRVRLVGVVEGLKSLAAPYLFCSLETARWLFNGLKEDQTIFILARCRNPALAETVARRLRRDYDDMTAFTAAEFSRRTRMHWVMTTKAGLATLWSALLGLVVGLVITSQTLYSATSASRREYAALNALGIPRWRVASAVLAQAFWVGGAGVVLGWLVSWGLARTVEGLGAKILLSPTLAAVAGGVTLATALLAGLIALRSVRLVAPMELLR
jgi:putative ABC transport system permease protein